MKTLLEKKLSTKERGKLDDKDFGLPKSRRYPINDKSHVIKAIQFFKACEKRDRPILAKNINNKLKEFDMTIKVSSDNPFYKYVDKKHLLKEGFEIPQLLENSLLTEYDILNKEEELAHVTTESPNELLSLHYEMRKIYNQFFEFHNYSSENKIKYDTLFYDLLDDILDSVIVKNKGKNFSINDEYELLTDIIKKCSPMNFRYIQRVANIIFTLVNKSDNYDSKHMYNFMSIMNTCEDISKVRKNSIHVKFIDSIDFAFKNLNVINKYVTNYLETRKNEIENQIDIIQLHSRTDGIGFSHNDIDLMFGTSIDINGKQHEMLCELNNLFNPVALKRFKKEMSFEGINIPDLMHLCEVKERIVSIYRINTITGDKAFIACGKETDKLYAIGKDISRDTQFYLVEINDINIDMFINENSRAVNKLNCVQISFLDKNIETNLDGLLLTEGININEDGDIKITISPKKSYMDSYSENHKLLVENWKNKNYDGVKENLAFAFALISIIERDPRYKNRENDVVKARAFAINDFKTYLAKIQEVDSRFDFVSYYKDTDFDKTIIDLPAKSILGIRNLLRMIMAG